MDENYIEKVVFKDDKKLYNKLKNLNLDIDKLHSKENNPFLIEFIGSCRSGKSTSINMIADVFRKHNFIVEVIDEEKVNITKDLNNNRDKKMNVDSLEYTNMLINEKITLYDYFLNYKANIIIFDRGINDEFNWLDTFSNSNTLSSDYNERLNNRKVDLLVIQTCDVNTSLKRKYFNSLSILPSKWTNYEVLSKYLLNLKSNMKYFKKHSKLIYKIDTTNADKIDAAINICNNIIEKMND